MNRKWTEQLSATPLDFALAQTYQFEVTAHSLGNSHIQDRDLADVTFTGYEGVEVGWIPMTQTLTNTVEATYLLVVTNTGNVNTTYDLSLAAPGLDFDLEDTILTIPPHIAAATIVRLRPATAGIYTILGQATTASLSDSSTAILVVTADVFAGANDDFVTLFEDGAITILVLANDQQGETPFTIIAISQPTHGTAVLHPPKHRQLHPHRQLQRSRYLHLHRQRRPKHHRYSHRHHPQHRHYPPRPSQRHQPH